MLKMKVKIKKIFIRERNVFLGFLFVTILVSLFFIKDFWKYILFLYPIHLITMTIFYARETFKNNQE